LPHNTQTHTTMNSSQINFFMMPEDVAELEQYIKEQRLVIVADTMPTPQLLPIDSTNGVIFTYILNPSKIGNVKIKYLENHQCYTIDQTFSPVIEFTKSNYNPAENTLRRGRLYYSKGYYNEANQWIANDSETLNNAAKLFKWFKQHFKGATKDNFFVVTPRTKQWIDNNNGKLLKI